MTIGVTAILISGKIAGFGDSEKASNEPSPEAVFPVGSEKLLCVIASPMLWEQEAL